jgi:hypothetical protein
MAKVNYTFFDQNAVFLLVMQISVDFDLDPDPGGSHIYADPDPGHS